MSRVTVIGCGHVGLVTAAGLAMSGHDVVGLDTNGDLIAELELGRVGIWEDGLSVQVENGLRDGNLQFTSSYASAIPGAEFVILCVDTPQTGEAGAASLTNIRNAARSIAEHLRRDLDAPIIVNKSTSPVGTAESIEDIFEEIFDDSPPVVSAPEFLRQGHAVFDFATPSRVVVGSSDRDAAMRVADLMTNDPMTPKIVMDLRSAELTKYVSNAFLATRVSFVNEIAQLCERVDADIDSVIEGLADDPRVGSSMFVPGIGYGGSCLPKDVAALRYMGAALGTPTPLLGAVQDVNRMAPGRIVHLLRENLGRPIAGSHITAWGTTFKGGTEDRRSSPAVTVIDLLVNEGALVTPNDPTIGGSMHETLRGSDALVVLTDWEVFRDFPPTLIADAMDGNLVIDGRNVLDPDRVRAAGLRYIGFGRAASPAWEAVR